MTIRNRTEVHTSRTEVRAVPLPDPSLTAGSLTRVDFSDAFEITLPAGSTCDPATWARALFASPPAWVTRAMQVRKAIVAPLGLRHGTGFPVLDHNDHEVLVGLDDRHLDFRGSVLTRETPEGDSVLVVSTLVLMHNAVGRAYFGIVGHLHPFVVRAVMRRAVARATDTGAGAGAGIGPRTRSGRALGLARYRPDRDHR